MNSCGALVCPLCDWLKKREIEHVKKEENTKIQASNSNTVRNVTKAIKKSSSRTGVRKSRADRKPVG